MEIPMKIRCRWLSARITSTVFFADQLCEANPEFTRWQIVKRNALACVLFLSFTRMPIRVSIEVKP